MTAALGDQFWTASLSLSLSLTHTHTHTHKHTHCPAQTLSLLRSKSSPLSRRAAFTSLSPKNCDRFGLEMNSLGTIKAPRYSVCSVCESVWVGVENEKLEKPQYLTRTVADSRKALDLFATGTSHWRQTAAQRNKWDRERDREQESALGREKERLRQQTRVHLKKDPCFQGGLLNVIHLLGSEKRGVQLYHTLAITQSHTHISRYVHTLLPLT